MPLRVTQKALQLPLYFFSFLSLFFATDVAYACYAPWFIHDNQHSQQPKKEQEIVNIETIWKLIEDSKLKRQRNQVDK